MEGFEPKRPGTDAATAENLKRLARMIDRGTPLDLRVNGRRVSLPAEAKVSVDLDRDPRSGRVQVDIRWSIEGGNTTVRECVDRAPRHESTPAAANKRSNGPHIRLKALVTAPTI